MRMTRQALISTCVMLLALSNAPAFADRASATGQIAKVDSDAGKVTIKHGAIKALDMPEPMTMVYRVKDPASLKALKAGDSVKFDIDHDTSGYVVTRIEKK